MAKYVLISALSIDGQTFQAGETVELAADIAEELKEILAVTTESEREEDESQKEKPLSRMNADELFAKAAELGVEVDPNATKKQVVEAIETFQAGETV